MSFVSDFNEQNSNNSASPTARKQNPSILSRLTHINECHKVETLGISQGSVTVIRPNVSALKNVMVLASTKVQSVMACLKPTSTRWIPSFEKYKAKVSEKKGIRELKKNRIHEAADKIDADQGEISFYNIIQRMKVYKEKNGSYSKDEIQENIVANMISKLRISAFYGYHWMFICILNRNSKKTVLGNTVYEGFLNLYIDSRFNSYFVSFVCLLPTELTKYGINLRLITTRIK